MLRLYDFWESGNAYKVRLLLSQLGEPFERVHLDILAAQPGHVLITDEVGQLVEWP